MKATAIHEFHADPGYAGALAALLGRIAKAIGPVATPVKLCIAGGAALHLYTGARYSNDVDAKVFARIALPTDDLQLAYTDSKGLTRVLYFDTQYNDTFALMHADAYDDAVPIAVTGLDASRLAPYVLTPLDLATSKVARFSAQDREDICSLAKARLIDAAAFRQRAEDSLPDYIGNISALKGAIRLAEKDIATFAGK